MNFKPNKWPHTFAMLVCVALLTPSCKEEKSETQLIQDFTRLDIFLRSREFNYDSVKTYVSRINRNFFHAESKQLNYSAWKTSVTYKWNRDSSLVLVYANKTYPVGFSREVILHSGDSILFIHRFSTEPLGARNRDDYTFLESIYYLSERRTIKHMDRIDHRKRELKDTVAFRKKLFADLSNNGKTHYSLELEHSKNILTLN